MAEESDHLLRFGIRTLPAIGGVQRSAMLVGGTPFSYGSTSDDGSDTFRNSPGMIRFYSFKPQSTMISQPGVVSVSTIRTIDKPCGFKWKTFCMGLLVLL